MPQSVTQTVTWSPVRIPLKWANNPDDVPVWDFSRGVDINLYDQAWPNHTNKIENFSDEETRGLESSWLDYAKDIHLSPRSAPPANNAAFSPVDLLPFSVKNYPRLVCAYPERLDRFDTPDTPVLQAMFKLGNYLDDVSRFEAEALKVALAYSLLADIHDYQAVENSTVGDTLADWLSFTVFVRTHLTLAQVLADEQQRGGEWHNTDDVLDEVWLSLPQQVRVTEAKRELGKMKCVMQGRPYLGLSHTVVCSAKEASERMHSLLWQSFTSRANLQYLGTKNLYVVNGCRVWALYELSLAYERAPELRTCPGCGTPFLPRRKSARYCGDMGKSNCRVAALRKRSKDKDA